MLPGEEDVAPRQRRKWVIGTPTHVLPTESGDYVLLTRPRLTPPPGSPQLTPIQPPPLRGRPNQLFSPPVDWERLESRFQPLAALNKAPVGASKPDLCVQSSGMRLTAARCAGEVVQPRRRRMEA